MKHRFVRFPSSRRDRRLPVVPVNSTLPFS